MERTLESMKEFETKKEHRQGVKGVGVCFENFEENEKIIWTQDIVI